MSRENSIINFLKRHYDRYSSRSRSTGNDSLHLPEISLKRTFITLILICLIISSIYLYLSKSLTTELFHPTPKINYIPSKFNNTKLNAFIITADCLSARFNVTKKNIENTFPNFFNILCHKPVPLNDSRITGSDVSVQQRFESNLITFIELWTYAIPKHSHHELEWSFIFEDDVNFNNASKVFLKDYFLTLNSLLNDPIVREKDGFMYLGICGPTYDNITQPIIYENTQRNFTSQRACGYCLHASGITTKRARRFWTDISSYQPSSGYVSLDFHLRHYCVRSNSYFYVFGNSIQYPPNTGHYGIAFQDRGRFPSTVFDLNA